MDDPYSRRCRVISGLFSLSCLVETIRVVAVTDWFFVERFNKIVVLELFCLLLLILSNCLLYRAVADTRRPHHLSIWIVLHSILTIVFVGFIVTSIVQLAMIANPNTRVNTSQFTPFSPDHKNYHIASFLIFQFTDVK